MMAMTIWLKGEWVRVQHGDPGPSDDGSCDYESKTITIRGGQTLVGETDTLLHEMIHYRWPHLTEDEVREGATEFAKALQDWGLLSG